MRILLLNQYFWPDRAATAQLLMDLAEDLSARGHRVTALTGRGGYAPGREGRLPRREEHQGVAIRRVFSTDFGRRTRLGRLCDYLTFLAAAAVAVAAGPRQDVVVALSTPPLLALLGLLARWRGARFVYKVEDLYPDVAVALGELAERSAGTRLLAALSRRVLARADRVVALDQAMARSLEARGARRVTVIPNWSDGAAIWPDPEAGAHFRRDHGISAGALVVLYSGNLGLAHRFDAVTAAVHRLAAGPMEVLFLFVGGGPRLPDVQTALAGQSTVRFLPYQPRERLGELYNGADLHLVTLRDEVAGLLSPSKYPAALSAGKPVLLVGGQGSDLFREVTARGVGWAVPHDPAAVTTALEKAATDRPGLARRGRRARELFEERYSRTAATIRWAELLEGRSDAS
jgi:glycosyltransferase involved in cell wall biosynthesis